VASLSTKEHRAHRSAACEGRGRPRCYDPRRTGGIRLVDEHPTVLEPTRRQPAAHIVRRRGGPVLAQRALAAAARIRATQLRLLGLAVTGALLEAALLLGWFPALSLAGHPAAPPRGLDPLVWRLGPGKAGVDHMLILLAIVFAPYLAALRLSCNLRGRHSVAIAGAGALIFGVTMLALFPAGAVDIFGNIVTARLFWVYHFNPMTVPPAQISFDPLFQYLTYWQGTVSPYGPVWFLLSGPAVLAGSSSLLHNVIAFKALAFGFELASLAIIVLIMQRVDPARTTTAIVCFGWNPLVLWETAGNGHNDILMMAFVLLALFLLLTPRWPFALPVLACSVLIKYSSLVLLPVFIVWIIYRHGRRSLLPLAGGFIVSVSLAAVLFAPFWSGTQTFGALGAQRSEIFLSPASAIIGDWGENLSPTHTVATVERLLTAVFVLGYLVVLLRLRSDSARLIRACVEVTFLLLMLVTWWFWPWYVIWGLALAALMPLSAHARVFVLFSATAMLIYVSSPWRLAIWNFNSPFPMAVGSALWVFAPPLLYVAMEVLRGGSPTQAAPVADSGAPRGMGERG